MQGREAKGQQSDTEALLPPPPSCCSLYCFSVARAFCWTVAFVSSGRGEGGHTRIPYPRMGEGAKERGLSLSLPVRPPSARPTTSQVHSTQEKRHRSHALLVPLLNPLAPGSPQACHCRVPGGVEPRPTISPVPSVTPHNVRAGLPQPSAGTSRVPCRSPAPPPKGMGQCLHNRRAEP